jgi:putative N6-adenine-specific DNA methylase
MKLIGLKPNRKMKLMNGDLECSFRRFEVYEGSRKTKIISK